MKNNQPLSYTGAGQGVAGTLETPTFKHKMNPCL